MVINPQSFGSVQTVRGLVEVVQPGDDPLDLGALSFHGLGSHAARFQRDARFGSGEIAAQLADGVVFVDGEHREERGRHGKNAGHHMTGILPFAMPATLSLSFWPTRLVRPQSTPNSRFGNSREVYTFTRRHLRRVP